MKKVFEWNIWWKKGVCTPKGTYICMYLSRLAGRGIGRGIGKPERQNSGNGCSQNLTLLCLRSTIERFNIRWFQYPLLASA